MTGRPEETQDRALRLSRRLVGLHVGGLAILVLVLLSTVFWISAEHNKLALQSSENMVRGGIASFRTRLQTLVLDYSIWDEAYAAVVSRDRDWLYSNIGNAAGEIGTLDMIVFVNPGEPSYGWRKGSPPSGESGLLPASVSEPILAMLRASSDDHAHPPTLLASLDGEPWAFSATHVRPVDDAAAAGPDAPVQIHGLKLSAARLEQIAHPLLLEGLELRTAPVPGYASVPLIDQSGTTIAHVVWIPPRPGARILRQVAPPLALALGVLLVISGISSSYAVRSARRLERALVAAKAADQSKTEFLSNVSHELRTPMNGILGVAQLLQTTTLDAEQEELVSVLFSSAHAQMALISDLLDFSRIESGNRQMVEEPFSPSAVLKDLTEMIRVAAAKKGIGFASSFAPLAELTVRGDERAFRQIITNLLGNAVKFTDRGGVTMRAVAHHHGGGVSIVVEVSDTGRGIPPEALPYIFDRFYQADSSLTRSTEGTGLGLAISQNLARMMGGRIEVESSYGVGSTFGFSASFAVVDEAGDERDAA